MPKKIIKSTIWIDKPKHKNVEQNISYSVPLSLNLETLKENILSASFMI